MRWWQVKERLVWGLQCLVGIEPWATMNWALDRCRDLEERNREVVNMLNAERNWHENEIKSLVYAAEGTIPVLSTTYKYLDRVELTVTRNEHALLYRAERIKK
jgi:hypothetical protein